MASVRDEVDEWASYRVQLWLQPVFERHCGMHAAASDVAAVTEMLEVNPT